MKTVLIILTNYFSLSKQIKRQKFVPNVYFGIYLSVFFLRIFFRKNHAINSIFSDFDHSHFVLTFFNS